MGFKYDGRGVQPTGGFSVIPDGRYVFRIVSRQDGASKAGDPQVKVFAQVAVGPYAGQTIHPHRVTFLPRDSNGAGIAVHFIKTLGEPWEGEYEVESGNWLGKLFAAFAKEDEYQGTKSTKLTTIMPLSDADKALLASAGIKLDGCRDSGFKVEVPVGEEVQDEIPF